MSDFSKLALDSFCNWLTDMVKETLERTSTLSPPFIVWCDPNLEWLELLKAASEYAGFELWAPESKHAIEHELLLRDRFYKAERIPRVVWLPCSREEITWFKIFELQAEMVWETSLLEALQDYGVSIPREHERSLASLLPAHAREWFTQPKQVWRELTPGTAKGTLVDDGLILEMLAGEAGLFQRLKDEERFGIFTRRALEDFGFPDPTNLNEAQWRISATARLLATEAAELNPQNPPNEGEDIIPFGLSRKNALRLLKNWQNHLQFIDSFEALSKEADRTLGLTYWAKNLNNPPISTASRAVEEAIFSKLTDRLDRIENVNSLIEELDNELQVYQERAKGFWEQQASKKIGWRYLLNLAEAASLLVQNKGIEETWQNPRQAIDWYADRGWQVDYSGEQLFIENPDMPAQLHRIRARLRKGYLRDVDRIGRAFSELLDTNPEVLSKLPTAGELALQELEQLKSPTALVYVDAFRLELGKRLVESLNEGEPVKRASLKIAASPTPSITALGMAFALPMKRDSLSVSYDLAKKAWHVETSEFSGNLIVADKRRKWLKDKYGVKDVLTINEVLDSDKLLPAGKNRRLIMVEGDEFDKEGHEGQLDISGTSEHLERYRKAIHNLRSAGYSKIVLLTDHGFFHWQPDADEIEDVKPDGDIFWLSRRAIVGSNLQHQSAIKLNVTGSNFEAMVPRSINAFKTYGGIGYFHGGATLQELIIPVIVINWPVKAAKVPVVLKPVEYITTEAPRMQVQAGVEGEQSSLFAPGNQLARRILIKVREPGTGSLVFKHAEPVIVEPCSEPITVPLKLVEQPPVLNYGSTVVVEVIDADNEELLSREDVILKVDIDEW